MLAPQTVAAGHLVHSGPSAPIAIGSTLPLSAMPAGTQVAPPPAPPSVPASSHEWLDAFCCKFEVYNQA